MNEDRSYKCETCGGKRIVNDLEESVPFCCGYAMEEDLPVCRDSDTAEHSRFNRTEEPCDDGRSGKI